MEAKSRKKTDRIGLVIKDKMQKSRIIELKQIRKDRLYEKYVKTRKCVMAHDDADVSKVGDTVTIIQSRPLSKKKRWVILEIMEKGESKNDTPKDSSDSSR